MAHDPFDDNGLLPMGESDSSDNESQAIWALLERRRKRRRDGLEAASHTRGENKPILWFIDEDGLIKPLMPEKTTWFQMFVAGQKHMDETDHKKFRNKFRLPHKLPTQIWETRSMGQLSPGGSTRPGPQRFLMMFWVRAMVAIVVAVVVVAVVAVVGVVAFVAAVGGRCICCVCQSGGFEWIAAWVLLPDWLGLIAICAKSSEERLLSECHGDSCEKFGCRREHLQPIKCGDAHAAHLQTQMEILQGLASRQHTVI